MPVPSGLGLHEGEAGYAGSYKDNMQQIIDEILGAGMEPLLAKVPIALGPCGNPNDCGRYDDPIEDAERNNLIEEYNQVVDELVSANGISVTPPDFYNYFLEDDPDTGEPRYETQYNVNDNYHPNGIGYQSMADLWFSALSQ
jgi:lysophospholipase L1-like esterase